MDPSSHAVPFDLEAPTPIMFWEPLEFVFAILLMGFGIVSHLWVLGAAGAVGVLVGSKYLKRGSKRGAMQHFIWSLGLNLDPALSKKFKPSWVNDFTE